MREATVHVAAAAAALVCLTLAPGPSGAGAASPDQGHPSATPAQVTGDVWGGSCSTPATGVVYDVGPGMPLTAIGQVPWTSLGPGDRVRIHARPTPYQEKVLISGQGTAAEPITVCGVPDAQGHRPVLDGRQATTRPGMESFFQSTQTRGLITLTAKKGDSWGSKPRYVVIDGLELTGAYPGNTFTDDRGTVRDYPDNAAGIFVERGEWITVRNCSIAGNGNGLFVASSDEDSASAHILVDANEFSGNSVAGRDREHQSYVEAEDVVYQFNHYAAPRAGSLGGALKDRSTGTVVRYNWIEGGQRALDLVEAQDSWPMAQSDPAYRHSWVYGNVIDLGPGDSSSVVHYGGDSGDEATYRKGALYFFSNTVLYRHDRAELYHATMFDLSTDDETAYLWNNAFYQSSATPGAPPTELYLARGVGTYHLGVNAFSPSIRKVREGEAFTGRVEGWDDQVRPVGNAFGFTDLTTHDVIPVTGSPLVDAGRTAPVPVPAQHALVQQYERHQRAVPRAVNGAARDLGARESGPVPEGPQVPGPDGPAGPGDVPTVPTPTGPSPAPANHRPTIVVRRDGSGLVAGRNGRSGTFPLEVADRDGLGSVTVTATTSDRDLVPHVAITGAGASWRARITITANSRRTGTARVTVTVSDGTASSAVVIGVAVGGSGPDRLRGGRGSDLVVGRGGDDRLSGGPGRDVLVGGEGRDVLRGGRGRDVLRDG